MYLTKSSHTNINGFGWLEFEPKLSKLSFELDPLTVFELNRLLLSKRPLFFNSSRIFNNSLNNFRIK